MNYPEEYLIGIRLFERGDYFESHEVWESLWKSTSGSDRDFFQGLIQLAVGLCHYYNGNMWGGGRMYRRSLSRLERYRPRHLGLNLEKFLPLMKKCFEPVLQADSERPIPFEADMVPVIELDPPPSHWPQIPQWVYNQES